MRILIDTHILIWLLNGDFQLSIDRREKLVDPANRVFISIASFWEIAIKSSRGKLSLAKSIEDIFSEIDRSSSTILTIEPDHTLQVSKLPFHHKDPFDRMIIAQAMIENIPLTSTDHDFTAYGVDLL
ncbi:MAG: type II toxin-antitoxin system VapC family toxin [Pyrinomonadaceae bacterium]